MKTKYDRDLNMIPSPSDPEFKVLLDGDSIDVQGSGASYEYNDDGTVDMLLTVDMKKNNLNKIYDVRLEINTMEIQIPYKEHEFINGEWILNFQVDGNEMADEVRVIDINKQIEIEYKDIKLPIIIEELRISPVSIKFKYKGDYRYNIKNGISLDFDLLDEDGNEIKSGRGGGNADGITQKYIIDKKINKINIIPKIVKYNRF